VSEKCYIDMCMTLKGCSYYNNIMVVRVVPPCVHKQDLSCAPHIEVKGLRSGDRSGLWTTRPSRPARRPGNCLYRYCVA
jgi:hypothetical protein